MTRDDAPSKLDGYGVLITDEGARISVECYMPELPPPNSPPRYGGSIWPTESGVELPQHGRLQYRGWEIAVVIMRGSGAAPSWTASSRDSVPIKRLSS